MTQPLLQAIDAYTRLHADMAGIARTPVPGLFMVRQSAPTGLDWAVQRPLVAFVVQGAKRVAMGDIAYSFGAGESLLIGADVPTVSQITRASVGEPYLSLALDLDRAVIAALLVDMEAVPETKAPAVQVNATDKEAADAALRLVQLLDRPASVPVLQAQLVRELHYWLLAGRHGPAIRRLGYPDNHVQRIGRAVAVLRAGFDKPLPVEQLAAAAGMSPSAFHQHFKAVTSLSPLQFQKQLRLIEAKRRMLAEGASPSQAAFAVGYESVPQFTREYGRMFGMPPGRDVRSARNAA